MRRRRLLSGGGGAVCVALAAFLAGCGGEPGGGYEPTAIYPPRTDLLFSDLSKVPPPAGPPAPGKLLDSIASLTAQGAIAVSPSQLNARQQAELQKALTQLFGTPAEPRVESPVAHQHGLTPERLAAGSRVYKKHCLQCHGMTGDGRGPTSLWVHPPARDFRIAFFKYTSTSTGGGWPTPADLHRILRRGIAGNSMPPFALLPDEDIDTVSAYTMHLIFRGQVEFDLIRMLVNPEIDDTQIAQLANNKLTTCLTMWTDALAQVVPASQPVRCEPREAGHDKEYDRRVRRGHQIFNDTDSACKTCHVNYGRQSPWRYDIWGVPVKPADLTTGHNRGGSEPADLFRRIRCGIPGSFMPAISHLTDEHIWDLVLFLKALPDPQFLPPDVRSEVYPNSP